MERTKKEIDMDYEQKYKEALERFKTFREKYCTYGELHFGDVIFDKTGEAQKDLDAIFPELTESEDERMIKAIEHILYENYSDAAVIEGVEIAEIVTWLEKPKEPIDPFDTKLFQDGVKEGRRLEREDIMKERQPAEWSEEDEKIMQTMIKDGDLKPSEVAWLKSRRPVKQEWSDEDEKTRRNLMSLLANMRGDRITEETYQKYYPWLKSLRSRPKPSDNWKPSEEQPQVADASKMEPEVDLEKEIDKGIADYSFTKTIDSGGFKTTVIDYAKIARHFYELGLNARKEE